MCRLLLLLVLTCLGGSGAWLRHSHGYHYHYGHRHPWHHSLYDHRFNRLAAHVAAADAYLQRFCKSNANCNVREIYEEQGYKLVYILPHCSVDYISVRIKHRVLHMSARQTSWYRPNTFVDMRILPDALKFNEAVWTYDQSKLEIVIPYKVDFKTELEKTCGDVSSRVIYVQQWGFRFSNRMGEDEDATENYTEGTETYDLTTGAYNVSDTTYPEIDVREGEVATNDRLIFSS